MNKGTVRKKGYSRLLLWMIAFLSLGLGYGTMAIGYPCGSNGSCSGSCGPGPYVSLSNIDPYYAGLEYKLTKIEARGDWDRIFNSSCPGPAFFFGGRFPNLCTFPLTFGLEFGYSWTVNKAKSTLIPAGGSFQGVTNDTQIAGAAAPLEASGKARLKSGYMELKAYLPLNMACYPCYYPELVVAIGVASSKPIIEVKTSPPTTADNIAQPHNLITQFHQLKGMNHTTLRAGIGLQGMFWDYWGIRAMARWEGFSALRADRNQQFLMPHVFKDAFSLSLGIYFTTPPF